MYYVTFCICVILSIINFKLDSEDDFHNMVILTPCRHDMFLHPGHTEVNVRRESPVSERNEGRDGTEFHRHCVCVYLCVCVRVCICVCVCVFKLLKLVY